MEIFDIPQESELSKAQMELVEQKKHEYHLVGSIQKRDGHTLFSFNVVTKEIKVARILKCTVYDMFTRDKAFNDKVDKEKDCIYLFALNRKNCIKHLKKIGYCL